MPSDQSPDWGAILAMLGAAIVWAFVPALIHWTLHENNSFIFGATSYLVQTSSLILLLRVTRPYCSLAHPPRVHSISRIQELILKRQFYLLCFRKSQDGDDIRLVEARMPLDFWRLPILLMMIGGCNIALLALASQFVETAIAAAIFETWPLFAVYGLVRFSEIDERYRLRTGRESKRHQGEHVILSIIATVGLLFMLLSQSHPEQSLVTSKALLGMALAVLSALLSGLTVVGSFIQGKALFYWISGEQGKPLPIRIEDRSKQDIMLLTWLTVLSLTVALCISTPFQAVLGLVTHTGRAGLDMTSLFGSFLMGIIGATTVLLLRLANTLSANPGINAIFYFAPVFAMMILLISGIGLRRLDLFVIGASLTLAINILIQLKPDDERDPRRFGIESRPGTRVGFVVLILSLWTFGSFIYLRDELIPVHWLEWPAGEYWGLVGLSATVFALILGFRITRLTDRMNSEDRLIIDIFRDSERLIRLGLLDADFMDNLSLLDRAKPSKLLNSYNLLQGKIRLAQKSVLATDHTDLLVSIQKQIDAVTHSKQQGREVGELFSLVSFAFVTISLGLLARQTPLDANGASAWNGFLSEMFVLLFSATVAFLLMNLFDLRRERETALLVPVKEHDGLFGLFFRNRKPLTANVVSALIVSLFIAVLFTGLLYNKWLGEGV